jgi:hypothetical protein
MNGCLRVRERFILFVKNDSRWTNRLFFPFVVGVATELSGCALPVSSRTDTIDGLLAALKTLPERKTPTHMVKALCNPAVFDSK